MLYAIFNIKTNIEKCPFTYWLNGRWFLQIVDRDSWNLYPLYPLFPLFAGDLGRPSCLVPDNNSALGLPILCEHFSTNL